MNDESDATQGFLIIYWVMSYGFIQLKIIRWVCPRQRAWYMKKENRLSKHSMSLIISNRAADKGTDRFVINSADVFTSAQHNHKMGVVSEALKV